MRASELGLAVLASAYFTLGAPGYPTAAPAVVSTEWATFVHSNNVRAVWADEDGVWWGSTGGVVRYDSATDAKAKIIKSVEGLRSLRITTVAEDARGRVWIGTEGQGVSVLDGSDWEFHSTQDLDLLSNEVSDIATFGPTTVVGTSGGVTFFRQEGSSQFFNGVDWARPGCDEILAVGVSGDQVLVGTTCGLLAYGLETGLWETLIAGKETGHLAYDGRRLFWITTTDSIYTYDGLHLSVITKAGIRPDLVRDIAASDSVVWVATNNGPSRYNFATKFWMRYADGIAQNLVDTRAISVGSDKRVWIATKNGAATLVDSAWVFRRTEGPAGNYIEDVCIDGRGKIWFTTGYRFRAIEDSDIGVLRFDGVSWEQLTTTTIPSNRAYCCETNPVDGSVWLGFWDGSGDLLRYDPGTGQWKSHKSLLESGVIPDIHIDPEGTVVFTEYPVGFGVLCSDNTMVHYSKDDENACFKTKCLTEVGPGPGGTYVFGSYVSPSEDCFAEVVLWDIGQDCSSEKGDDDCQAWAPVAGWAQGNAYHLATDPYGVMWFGNSGGLNSYDGKFWRRVNTALGAVWDIEIDSDGNKWVGTDQGLLILRGSGAAWSDFSSSFELYNSTNSPLEAAPIKAIEFDADGAVWMGTGGGGVYRFYQARGVSKQIWVDVFPNPYEAAKDGLGRGIRFSGFLPGSRVLIYTLAGDLVADIGADEAWHARNGAGEEVASGVYIFSTVARDGSEFRGRIAIIR